MTIRFTRVLLVFGILVLSGIGFGQETASIEGHIYQICVSGIDTTRTGLEGIAVKIYDTDIALVTTAVTDASGYYSADLERERTYHIAPCHSSYISAPLHKEVYLTSSGSTNDFDMILKGDVDLDCTAFTLEDVRRANSYVGSYYDSDNHGHIAADCDRDNAITNEDVACINKCYLLEDSGNYNSYCWGLTSGTCVDIDGNIYETIVLGTQVWMAENLKTTHYRDGTPIPTGFSDSEWENLDDTETGAYAEYGDDPSNVAIYGRLYNWYAVDNPCGLCPDGWHVPTDEEWQTLVDYLGSSAGSKLAGRADLWSDGDLESDPEFGTSGFTALPGGYRIFFGLYYDMAYYAYFWSSSEYSSPDAWNRVLFYYCTDVYRHLDYKRYGFSVRCLRD